MSRRRNSAARAGRFFLSLSLVVIFIIQFVSRVGRGPGIEVLSPGCRVAFIYGTRYVNFLAVNCLADKRKLVLSSGRIELSRGDVAQQDVARQHRESSRMKASVPVYIRGRLCPLSCARLWSRKNIDVAAGIRRGGAGFYDKIMRIRCRNDNTNCSKLFCIKNDLPDTMG